MKETVLKSVHVAFDELSQPEIQLQYVERLTVDGEVIRETYLPHERFSLLTASTADKARIEAALGEALMALGQRSEAQAAELEALKTNHAAALRTLTEAAEQQRAELAQARAEIERLSAGRVDAMGGAV